mmetsp:Transcript_24153/g.33871  ORF Transcript_24153/g.33871 Transcript_24153/m.33871 type:complete len:153 (+) Transcript_24153:53-511(+)
MVLEAIIRKLLLVIEYFWFWVFSISRSFSINIMDPSLWFRIGGLNGALAVAMGAFGAHGLRQRVQDERILAAFQTGSHYHLIHSVALLVCPFVAQPHANIVGALFVAGNVLFSGSLYAMGLTENRKFGAITPIGGLAFIAGWITLALAKKRI